MSRPRKEPKRRIRSPHPGVKIIHKIRSDGQPTWYGRFIDPDLGRTTQTNLTVLNLTTLETRRDWAIAKSRLLARRSYEIEVTGQRRTETTFADATKVFKEARASELKASTKKCYSDAATELMSWAARRSIIFTESITSAHLFDFRTSFLLRPAHARARGIGVRRGTRKPGSKQRAPATINKTLRALKTILNYWRARGITPNLNGDSIRDTLKPVKQAKPLPVFMRAHEIQALLDAAIRHDRETFTATREEHAGIRVPGTTPRYAPIARFVAAVLLTGMRFSELANLRWRDVDLKAGEITLQHDRTKTSAGRRVGLAETPALAALLTAMKLQAGDNQYVWGEGPYRRDLAESARKRLMRDFAAPLFTWQHLRRTCGTFLCCAPSIYGAASAWLSAKRLGHSVLVSEKHYAGAIGVSHSARTLEAAFEIEDKVAVLITPITGQVPLVPISVAA
ncbi:MAG: tyrosine-type recombinase/integrase [Planctomycetes bacterium]|nr:tyrosine-type recombinase/integrase [Planctomycetota bacterium]